MSAAETPEQKNLRLAVCRLRLLLDMRVSDGYDAADVVNAACRELENVKASRVPKVIALART